ncbi:MAG TPA: hypothetical protein VMW10_00610 [Alphaproteobacteria bacterium]|nr:hypothetical protein [Alphaproteobacteria bacterium]
MKLEGGKGSHKKFSFADALQGRRILNLQNNEVFRFPDFANASYVDGVMTVIPRWEGDNPPVYMIGALRHILEKLGAKETNVFKNNEKRA